MFTAYKNSGQIMLILQVEPIERIIGGQFCVMS